MTYVITEACITVKDRSCVDVCPVDCIHPRVEEDKGEIQLYIDPGECIDCGACEPACPVSAIFAEDDVPEKWRSFIDMNTDYYKLKRDAFTAKWSREP
jgi:NAD-dependent dihydropyrimidine dehydrogenase PreA subunit